MTPIGPEQPAGATNPPDSHTALGGHRADDKERARSAELAPAASLGTLFQSGAVAGGNAASAPPAEGFFVPGSVRQWPWAFIATGIVAVWIPLKLLRVARQDPSVALMVAQNTDTAVMVPALLMLGLTLVIPTSLVLIAAATTKSVLRLRRELGESVSDDDTRALLALTLPKVMFGTATSIGLLLVACVAQPLWVPITSLVATGVLTSVELALRGRDPLKVLTSDQLVARPQRVLGLLIGATAAGVFALVVAAAQLPLSDQMWLPAQRIELNFSSLATPSGRPGVNLPPSSAGSVESVMVGYVLDQSGEELVFLTETDRRIVSIPNSQVSTVRLCSLERPLETRSLSDLLGSRRVAGTPQCPAPTN